MSTTEANDATGRVDPTPAQIYTHLQTVTPEQIAAVLAMTAKAAGR